MSTVMKFFTVKYDKALNVITILDQTKLPGKEVYRRLKSIPDVYKAIKTLQVRGAPLIGVVAAYALVMSSRDNSRKRILQHAEYIKSARPTAVNLAWAVERMKMRLNEIAESKNLFNALYDEARAIENEDKEACLRIGKYGARLIKDGYKIMVHCNAGALATSGMGTALGVLYLAKEMGKKFCVYSCETRPLLQGARLTTWELTKNGIETYTICDNMAAFFMSEVNMVLVGADRIAGNGDTANKIGTRGLAIIAHYHKIPFYVAAPISSFDFEMASGRDIPIECRSPKEVIRFNGQCITAKCAKIFNPAFDVTPASLITGIITEKGIIRKPCRFNIKKLKNNFN